MGQVSRSAHIKGWARQAFVQRFSQNLESLYGLGFTYSMIPSLRDMPTAMTKRVSRRPCIAVW